MKTLTVLMSTYNGEKYIEQQLESVANNVSDDLDIKVLVRDDGSTDGTIQKINSLTSKLPLEVKVITGHNVGVQKSFLDLIDKAPITDYYAFCDQDDFWADDKAITIISKMNDYNFKPCVCISNYNIVDKNLNVTFEKNYKQPLDYSVLKILMANNIPGCIMVFNWELMKLLKENSPKNVPMHDVYVLLMACLFGEIIHVPKILFSYRIHGNNAVGVQKKHLSIKHIIKQQKKIMRRTSDESAATLARYCLSLYKNRLSVEKIKELEIVANSDSKLKYKLKLLRQNEIYVNSIRTNLLLVERVLLGKK
ncbi:MAG: glycosyltransferase [Clostridiaceae bacterium]|nr:glycosyltransferase [Clostridiaceae bacterium]